MRAMVIQDEFGIDGLKIVERDVPEPQTGEVLVRVKANSLNYRDLMTVQHGASRGLTLPLVPNSDGAGEVVSVGAGVTRVAPGDRVMGIFMQNWLAGGPTQAHAATALVPLQD